MTPRQSRREIGTGAARAALVLLSLLPARSPAQADQAPQPVGILSTPTGAADLGRALQSAVGEAVASFAPCPPWQDLGRAMARGDGPQQHWRIVQSSEGAILPEPEEGQAAAGQPFALDLSLDLVALRRVSAQPFSRSARGRALDALGLDNARRARIAAVSTPPEESGQLTLVLFSESRAEQPGRWHALPIATVRFAPMLGEPPPARPLAIDFAEQWEGVLLSLADLALALTQESDAISAQERMQEWGPAKAEQLRALAAGLDGRAWLWRASEGGGLALALPLRRGASERAVASSLAGALGPSLQWRRSADGRSTGWLSCAADAPSGPGPRLALRFITTRERTVLAVSPREAELDAAPAILASLAD